ncbi:hypothetical protein QCA50_012746 [Cerrena zonata]|uniref:Uncharacterized protein n=1 Tax=Cerrena zonata TaxID=2478898 RepID=A0AAW0FSU7_9APHY
MELGRIVILFILFALVAASSLLGCNPEDFNIPVGATVREYKLDLTHVYHNPSGKYKSGFLINGQSPGPALEGDEGDWMLVKVVNQTPVSMTIHFHGILQIGTPWSDGVPGVTQFPILSGDSYVYAFQLRNQSGSTWYHAHYRGYATDGVYGPFYIRPSKERIRPYHLITNDSKVSDGFYDLERSPQNIIGDDSFHLTMDDVMARMFHFGIDPLCIQSILINGKGRVYCHDHKTFVRLALKTPNIKNIPSIDTMGCARDENANGYHDIEVDNFELESPGFSRQCEPTFSDNYVHYTNNSKWQYLNILNAGGQHTKAFSIDDHALIVVAIDGVFVEPATVHQLLIPVGSRFTVLVETDPTKHAHIHHPFPIRFAAVITAQFIEGVGYLVYGNETSFDSIQLANLQNYNGYINGVRYQDIDGKLLNPNHKYMWPHQTRPYEDDAAQVAKGGADHTFNLYLNRTGLIEFSMFEDGTKLPPAFELAQPLLHQLVNNPSKTFAGFQGSLSNDIKYGDVIDFIINNHKRINHPIHLHGHLFHLISYSETENFPHRSVEEAERENYKNLNLQNPPYFDIALVPAGGHAVVRIIANNPGIWLIHCHNLGHLLGGMGAILFEALDQVPETPQYYLNQAHIDLEPEQHYAITELPNNTHDGSILT